jgi:hypothetical protein
MLEQASPLLLTGTGSLWRPACPASGPGDGHGGRERERRAHARYTIGRQDLLRRLHIDVQRARMGSQRRGVDPLLGPRIASYYRDVGASGMEVKEVDLPVGRYGGRLGGMAEVDVFGVIGGVKPLIVSAGITDGETYERAMTQARADLDRWRCTLPFYIAYGQKPML